MSTAWFESTHDRPQQAPLIREPAWDVSGRRRRPAPPPPKPGESPGQRLDRGHRVLVVDDEPVVADTVAEILNRSGFEALAVHSSEAALEQARDFRPAILLADVIMPDKDGVDTAIELRRLLPDLRVILFSGQAQTSDLLRRARYDGYAFELLPKPIHPRELLKKLRS